MCDTPNIFTALVEGAPAAAPPRGITIERPGGSRRRRLWELPSQALCPVIGVCLPIPLLRRRFDKRLGGMSQRNDYELHCGAINECNRRTPMAEALQKELDQRYLRALREAARCKTTLALRAWWEST